MTEKTVFYDRMAIDLGLPYTATREWWRKSGREVLPNAIPRYTKFGETFFGLEATFVARGVAVEEKSPEQKFDEAVARVRDVLEKESNDAMIARDEARSQEAKVWALQQHLKELRTRESAPKPVGPTVHAPMAALQLCADLEPRGYLR